MLEKYNDTLEVKDLCEVLNICPNKAYDLLKFKTIHSVRCGKKYIIPKVCVIDYLMSAFGDNDDNTLTENGYDSILYSNRDSLSIRRECI